MKLTIMAAAGLALGLVGCEAGGQGRAARAEAPEGGKLRTVAQLECPEREGDLRLASRAGDGRACSYRSERGGEVELRLARLDGRSPAELLTPIETELRGLVPTPDPTTRQPNDTGVALGVGGKDKEVEVRLPGLSVDAKGDRANIRMPGLSINADDRSARVNISTGDHKVLVNADDGGAEIRMDGSEGSDIRSSYILAQETPRPGGWRTVAYEARGPQAGPLVIATTKIRDEDDDAFDDAKDLLRRNVGR